jgi:membrane protein
VQSTARQRIQARRRNLPTNHGPVRSFFDLLYRIVRGAFLTFSNAKAAEASSSLAYYTIFSIFPLLIVIVRLGSLLVDPVLIQQELTTLLPNIFPVGQDFILENLENLTKVRGTISIISMVGLIWSASAVFSTLIRNVNSAWPAAAPRSYFNMKLTSIGAVGILVVLLIVSSFSLMIKNLILSLSLSGDLENVRAFLSNFLFAQLIPYLIRILVFFGLYSIVPQIQVKKKSAWIGAFLIATIWQAVMVGLNAYLSMRLTQYQVVYGSLAKVILMLAWIYFTGWIILFGAHLTSSIDRHTK